MHRRSPSAMMTLPRARQHRPTSSAHLPVADVQGDFAAMHSQGNGSPQWQEPPVCSSAGSMASGTLVWPPSLHARGAPAPRLARAPAHPWPSSASRHRTRCGAARTGRPHPCRVRTPGRMTPPWTLDVEAWAPLDAGDSGRLMERHDVGRLSMDEADSSVAPWLHAMYNNAFLRVLRLQRACQLPGQGV